MADDFSSRLNTILSDPSAMSQIMSLASGIMSGGEAKSDQGSTQGSGEWDSAKSDALPGGFSRESSDDKPDNLQKSDDGAIPTGLISFSKKPVKDDSCELLRALKPFLRRSRADKIDMMISVLQISRLAKKR